MLDQPGRPGPKALRQRPDTITACKNRPTLRDQAPVSTIPQWIHHGAMSSTNLTQDEEKAMGISGCTSCQLGGFEALRAYEQQVVERKQAEASQVLQQLSAAQDGLNSLLGVNQPAPGAISGSQINIRV